MKLNSESFREARRFTGAVNDSFIMGEKNGRRKMLHGDLSSVNEVEIKLYALNKRGEFTDTTITITQ